MNVVMPSFPIPFLSSWLRTGPIRFGDYWQMFASLERLARCMSSATPRRREGPRNPARPRIGRQSSGLDAMLQPAFDCSDPPSIGR